MKRLSIKARVTFWYTLLVALIALLAAGALFWSAQRMMDNYYEEALVGTTQLALNDVRMEDGQLKIDRNLDDLPSVRVSLYTQSGDLIYGKWRFDLPFEENVIRPAAERSASAGMCWTRACPSPTRRTSGCAATSPPTPPPI